MTADVRRARRAYLAVGVVAPAVITLVSVLVVAVWLPDLPDPAATHWSQGANPDGFGPSWTYLVLGGGVPLGVIVLFGVIALFAHRLPPRASEPTWSPTARFLGAMSLAVAGLMSLTTLVSVGVQRGLEDAADAPDVTPWMFAGFGVMVVLGVIGWFLQPAVRARARAGDEPAALSLTPNERTVWVGTATTAPVGRIVIGAATLIALASGIVMAAAGADGWGVICGVGVLLLLLGVTMFAFRVRVSAAGVLVKSALGWPRFRVPLSDVASARAIAVNPFAEFGGWGLRWAADGRFGVVLRAGDALEVKRRSGRSLVVTIDDARTAASLLTALKMDAAASVTEQKEER